MIDCKRVYQQFRERHPAVSVGSRVYSDEERAFVVTMDRYIHANHRKFPSFVEVLHVALALGYRKVGPEAAGEVQAPALPTGQEKDHGNQSQEEAAG
jgi:hypothetical protein